MNIDYKLYTDHITDEIIDYMIGKIVREIDPEKIILFGSRAGQEYRSDSDVDLLIINGGDESNKAVRKKIASLLWGKKFPVDILVRKPEEIERNIRANNAFYAHHILNGGKVLYERR